MSAGEAITSIVSGMAIVISVLSLLLTYRRDRAHLKVEVSTMWEPSSVDALGRHAFSTDGPRLVGVTIRNDGRYPETVSVVGFEAGKNTPHLQLTAPAHFPQGQPPHRLEVGQEWLCMIPLAALAASWEYPRPLRRAYVKCASGHEYRGRLHKEMVEHLDGSRARSDGTANKRP